MKTQVNRLTRLEREAPADKRQFIAWAKSPWTPEQEAQAVRRRPGRRVHWRSLLAAGGDSDAAMTLQATADCLVRIPTK